MRREKRIQRNLVVLFEVKKFQSDNALTYPLDGIEQDFDRRFVPREFQCECKLLAPLKPLIGGQTDTIAGDVEESSLC